MTFVAKASLEIARPIADVWRALTDPALVKQYFFGTNLVTSWQVGSPIYFRGEWEGTSYEDKGTVLALVPHSYLRYSYLSSWSNLPDKPENYQHLTYRVAATANGTLVTIEQEDITTAEQQAHAEQSWTGILQGMKDLLEA